MLTLAIIGLAIGLVMGLTGAGGGVLAVPALVMVMGWTMAEAAPTALLAVMGGAWIGTFDSLRRRIARYRAALWIALIGIPATSLGLIAARHTPERALKIIFALLLVWLALRFLRTSSAAHAESLAAPTHPLTLDPETGRFVWTWTTAALLGAMGIVTGFAAGLLGVGGGFVLVPLLKRYTPLTMQHIVATSLMVVALVSLGGVVSATLHGAPLSWRESGWFIAATIAGVIVSRALAPHLREITIQRGFAALLLVAAAAMAWKAWQL